MSTTAVVEELRLTKFKSFRDAVLPLHPLTLLIGRNGSGKSNALDGLEVLAKLASGRDIREALDGSDGPAIRGGTVGCAPLGEQEFSLGCTVRVGDTHVLLDVTVQVEPETKIVREHLRIPDADGGERSLRYDRAPEDLSPLGLSRLLMSQAHTFPSDLTEDMPALRKAADEMVAALSSIFVLDPVPHLMRQYVPERDFPLRRRGENLSAAVGHLREDREAWDKLLELLRALPEQRIESLSVERSPLGDVMLAVRETFGDLRQLVPARLMSDGMLRFLAFAVALLETPPAARSDTVPEQSLARRTLVIEELENSLFPSQAARLLELIRHEARRRQLHLLATTHSPALLSALSGSEHESVIVCDRDPDTGWSRLRPLVDLPGYPKAMARGSLGDAVTRGLVPDDDRGDSGDFDRLLESL